MDNVPIFLRIDDFKKLKKNIDEINEKVILTEDLINELKAANEEEKKRIEAFEEQLSKIKKVMNTITSKVNSPNEE